MSLKRTAYRMPHFDQSLIEIHQNMRKCTKSKKNVQEFPLGDFRVSRAYPSPLVLIMFFL